VHRREFHLGRPGKNGEQDTEEEKGGEKSELQNTASRKRVRIFSRSSENLYIVAGEREA